MRKCHKCFEKVKEGRGTYRYASGNVYDGEWKSDKREGHGTYRFADGDEFEEGD